MVNKKITTKEKKPEVKKKTTVKEVAVSAKKTIKNDMRKIAQTKKKEVMLTIPVYDISGKIMENIPLPGKIFDAKINTLLMSQAVRVYRANQRMGTASTKTRGEVQGSTKKIYRQKGTGGARHGGKRAPIFVHGGIAHGPHPHDYSLKLPQKMKQAALFSALTSKFRDGQMLVVSGLGAIEPKTKVFASAIDKVNSQKQKKILLVLAEKQDKLIRAARNVDSLTYVGANQLNTYEVINNRILIFMKEAITTLEKTFTTKA